MKKLINIILIFMFLVSLVAIPLAYSYIIHKSQKEINTFIDFVNEKTEDLNFTLEKNNETSYNNYNNTQHDIEKDYLASLKDKALEEVEDISAYRPIPNNLRSYYRDLENIMENPEKRNLIIKLYRRCKLDGFEYSCVAIAWKESRFMEYVVNYTHDYGLMGININYLVKELRQEGIRIGKYSKLRLITRLIMDIDYNIDKAITNLHYWKRVRKGDWLKIWASYNGGWKMNFKYARDIKKRISAFKLYLYKHPLLAELLNSSERIRLAENR